MEPLEEDDVIYDLAQALDQISGQRVSRKALDFVPAERARAFVYPALDRVVTLDARVVETGGVLAETSAVSMVRPPTGA